MGGCGRVRRKLRAGGGPGLVWVRHNPATFNPRLGFAMCVRDYRAERPAISASLRPLHWGLDCANLIYLTEIRTIALSMILPLILYLISHYQTTKHFSGRLFWLVCMRHVEVPVGIGGGMGLAVR